MTKKQHILLGLALFLVFLIPACNPKSGDTDTTTDQPNAADGSDSVGEGDAQETEMPAWFEMPLTDVQTGETFTMADFSGKVVLVETMAMWCPNCIVQANEVRNLHKLLDNPEDLVSVSLDVDVNEDEASLKEYSEGYGFDWHFAIAPLQVARALGNLYSAQYLNPPISPMLVIDRNGEVHELPYGQKDAETLLTTIQPFLDNK